MRNFAFASLVVAVAVIGACSAVDDFTKFKFSDGGATGDMNGALPEFGQACVDACAVGADPAHPLSCYHMFGMIAVPGGICTHSCNPASVVSCAGIGIGVADCVTVENTDVCLPHCDPSVGRNCRTNYSCCANHNVVTDVGDCAPSTTDLCH
ncbi:MAG TPA: hypothetical protein VF997_17790 [Polyangia bacterium]